MGIIRCVRTYPVGTMVRLESDDKWDDPHRVIGYKDLNGAIYLMFEDGVTALSERVAESFKNNTKNQKTV